MKRLLIALCLIAASVFTVKAQEKPDPNKMVQDRVTYMKENLKLNATESKTFWTAYEQYLRSEMTYHNLFRDNLKKKGINIQCPNCANKEPQELSDKQLTYKYEQKFELKKNLYTLETNFYKKISSILTPKHLDEFYRLDEKYKREIVYKKTAAVKSVQGSSNSTSAPTPTKKRR